MATVIAKERPRKAESPSASLSETLEAAVSGVRSRHPAVGFAIGIVANGEVAIRSRGLSSIASGTLVDEDTVFRIGSITKTFTAIAVMQLAERGLIDLDAPARTYLRAYPILEGRFRAPTVRHLLTHTSGIPDLLHARDLLRSSLTPSGGRPPMLSVPAGEPLPSLAEHYRAGIRVVAEPGRAFAYSNPGFATLGQIVEDVSGVPLERYLRERIFEPLGMVDTSLARTERLAPRRATGYILGRRGPTPAPDEDWLGAGAGGAYSTPRDVARYARALLGGGRNETGSILDPATLATMFEPSFEADPRLRGMGLGFFRRVVAGHRMVSHDGIMPGFNCELLVAPDDDVAVFGLTNGSPAAFGWLSVELEGLITSYSGIPPDMLAEPIPQLPETWSALCGRYVLQPPADLRERLMLGAGAEVFVDGDHLAVRVLTPIPALLAGHRLERDDPADPRVFRLDLSGLGVPPVRVVFAGAPPGRATAIHTDLGGQPWSLVAAPGSSLRRTWSRRALGVAVAAVIARTLLRGRASR